MFFSLFTSCWWRFTPRWWRSMYWKKYATTLASCLWRPAISWVSMDTRTIHKSSYLDLYLTCMYYYYLLQTLIITLGNPVQRTCIKWIVRERCNKSHQLWGQRSCDESELPSFYFLYFFPPDSETIQVWLEGMDKKFTNTLTSACTQY